MVIVDGERGAGEGHIRLILFFDILNGASAFNTANSEAGRVDEAADDARLPL